MSAAEENCSGVYTVFNHRLRVQLFILRRGEKNKASNWILLWNVILAFGHKLEEKNKKNNNHQTVWMEKRHKTSYKAVNGFHLLMPW